MEKKKFPGIILHVPYFDKTLPLPFTYQDAIRLQGVVEPEEIVSNKIAMALRERVQAVMPVCDVVKFPFYLDEIIYQYTQIYLHFYKYGVGLDTLGILDKLTLGEIDPYSIGALSHSYVDWLLMQNHDIAITSQVSAKTESSGLQISASQNVSAEKQIYLGSLAQNTYATGVVRHRTALIGELDQKTMADMDSLTIGFHIFDKLPATEE